MPGEIMKWLRWIVAAVLLVAPLAMAAPTAATKVTTDGGSTYTTPTADNDINNVTAGYVYEANIEYATVTQHWAGIYGKIFRTIVLGDSSGNIFFKWNGTLDATGVYLSEESGVNWSGNFVGDITSQDINDAGIWSETSLTFDDNLENTIVAGSGGDDAIGDNTGACAFVDAQSLNFVAGTNYRYLSTEDNAGTNYWVSCYFGWDSDDTNAIDNTADGIVVAGSVDPNGHAAYNGVTAHYQVLVPTNTTGIVYYVWVA